MNSIQTIDTVKINLLNACDRTDFNTIKEMVNGLTNISTTLLNEVLCHAATSNLQAVKYLLTSTELNFHPNVNCEGCYILYNACTNEKIDIVKYLLTSPELKEHSLVHHNEDQCFIHMCGLSRYSIIEYLILDYGIERTEFIDNYLKKYSHPNVEHMFKMQQLNKELNTKLSVNKQSTNHKNKL